MNDMTREKNANLRAAIFVFGGAFFYWLGVKFIASRGPFDSGAPPTIALANPERISPVRLKPGSDLRGKNATRAEGATLVRGVETNPNDADARASLMGYAYFHPQERGMERLHNEQVAWFVANLPDSPVLGYDYGKIDFIAEQPTYVLVDELYANALRARPRDAAVLANYAGQILLPEADRAVALLRRAVQAKPNDPELYVRLADALTLEAAQSNPLQRKADARLALQALTKAEGLGRVVDRKKVILAAFDAARGDLVQREASALLKRKNDPESAHIADTFLGRQDLRNGEMAQAKARLAASAADLKSVAPGSLRPSTELVAAFVRQGERSTVITFLEATQSLWGKGVAQRWISQVQSGEAPDWTE